MKPNIDMSAPIISRFNLYFILVDNCNVVTDYAIARRIIDLHTKLQESVERVCSEDQVARYDSLLSLLRGRLYMDYSGNLGFARMFKPRCRI